MTNNPVPPDKPYVYALSKSRLVLLASMILMLIALGMMLGIRIERQQQAKDAGIGQTAGLPVKKKAALPTGSASKAKKAKSNTTEAAASKEKKSVAKASTAAKAKAEPAKDQPEPSTAPTQTKQEETSKEPIPTKTVVEAKEPTAPAPEKTVRPGHYAVQVESSQDKNKASLQVEILRKKGLKAYVKEVDLEGKGQFYRVMVGPFQTKTQAAEAKDILNKDSRFTDSFVKYIP